MTFCDFIHLFVFGCTGVFVMRFFQLYSEVAVCCHSAGFLTVVFSCKAHGVLRARGTQAKVAVASGPRAQGFSVGGAGLSCLDNRNLPHQGQNP